MGAIAHVDTYQVRTSMTCGGGRTNFRSPREIMRRLFAGAGGADAA